MGWEVYSAKARGGYRRLCRKAESSGASSRSSSFNGSCSCGWSLASSPLKQAPYFRQPRMVAIQGSHDHADLLRPSEGHRRPCKGLFFLGTLLLWGELMETSPSSSTEKPHFGLCKQNKIGCHTRTGSDTAWENSTVWASYPFRGGKGIHHLVATGDPYLRSMSARGEDFLYVSVQPVQHLSTSPVAFLLQRLSKYLESKYSIDIPPAELHFEITGGERIPNGYTLLDLVFVAATSAYRNDHFADSYKILRITLDLRPILVPLGPSGQNLL